MSEPAEALLLSLVVEARRRGYRMNATCAYCGEVFVKQDLGYVLAHRAICKERETDG